MGELAVVVGSPLVLTETVTAGIVSGLHRMPRTEEAPQGLFNLFQTDAANSPGNSGGAVVDLWPASPTARQGCGGLKPGDIITVADAARSFQGMLKR